MIFGHGGQTEAVVPRGLLRQSDNRNTEREREMASTTRLTFWQIWQKLIALRKCEILPSNVANSPVARLFKIGLKANSEL